MEHILASFNSFKPTFFVGKLSIYKGQVIIFCRDKVVKVLVFGFVGKRTNGATDFEASFKRKFDEMGSEVARGTSNENGRVDVGLHCVGKLRNRKILYFD